MLLTTGKLSRLKCNNNAYPLYIPWCVLVFNRLCHCFIGLVIQALGLIGHKHWSGIENSAAYNEFQFSKVFYSVLHQLTHLMTPSGNQPASNRTGQIAIQCTTGIQFYATDKYTRTDMLMPSKKVHLTVCSKHKDQQLILFTYKCGLYCLIHHLLLLNVNKITWSSKYEHCFVWETNLQ